MILDDFKAQMEAEFLGQPFNTATQTKAASRIIDFVNDLYADGGHLFDSVGSPIIDPFDVEIRMSWDDTCLMLDV